MSKSSTNILLSGCSGKMGTLIKDLANEFDCNVVVSVDSKNSLNELSVVELHNVDVCIDFSSSDGLKNIGRFCANNKLPIISGTTGLDDECLTYLKNCSKTIPILYSSNFSIGIFALNNALKVVARVLEGFDIDIIERHHIFKKDSPSGTAKCLLNVIKDLGLDAKIYSLRSGNCQGEHEIVFGGVGETVKLTHEATDRAIFAKGALSCVEKFLKISQPGFYSLNDIFS